MLICRLTASFIVNTIRFVRIEFDPRESARNEAERQLPFERAADFGSPDAIVIPDDRNDYHELRFVVVGYLDGRLHVLCFTPIEGGARVISFRKANKREARRYGKPITIDQ
jgi:hypothetical protein